VKNCPVGVALFHANRWTDVTRLTNTPTEVELIMSGEDKNVMHLLLLGY